MYRQPPFSLLLRILLYLASAALLLYLIVPRTALFFRKDYFGAFTLHLNHQDLVLVKGETERLYVVGLNLRVSFSSTDMKVAHIDFLGNIRTFRTGTTYLTASVRGQKLRCRLRVIALNHDRLTLSVGDTKRLHIDGIFAYTRFHSSDTRVATVSRFGNIRAHSAGTAIITAEVRGKKLTCALTVQDTHSQ